MNDGCCWSSKSGFLLRLSGLVRAHPRTAACFRTRWCREAVVLRCWPTPHATHSTDGDAAHTVMTAEHDTPQPQEDEDDKEARDLRVRRPEGEAEQYREQVMEMLAISFGLAQSVKLVVFENEMEVRRCH